MSEHRCRECKTGKSDTCTLTGATHTTGIECPSFKQKESEMFKVGDKVRVVADEKRLINCGIYNKYTGKLGVIETIDNSSLLPLKVTVGDNSYALNMAARDLELVGTPTEVGQAARTFDNGAKMEAYESGATRTKCETKIDPEGFFSPLVILRYSEYMHKCRTQADGTVRNSDNWQGGIPLWRYMKGKWRHFLDTWLIHRGYKKVTDEGLNLQDCLCAELFNTMGYLHVMLCEEKSVEKDTDVPALGGAHKNFKDRTVSIEGGS